MWLEKKKRPPTPKTRERKEKKKMERKKEKKPSFSPVCFCTVMPSTMSPWQATGLPTSRTVS